MSSFISKSDDLIKLDDLLETKNHFKLFDYMLDNVDTELTVDMIIEMNKILKKIHLTRLLLGIMQADLKSA